MTRRSFLLPALFAAVALSGCRTFVLESHRRPIEPKLTFERTVVIVNVPEEGGSERARRVAENELAGQLAALNASPSFRLIAPEDLGDAGQIRDWATAEGFDGLVLVWFEREIVRHMPTVLLLDEIDMPARDVVRIRLNASVVSLKEDREVWTGVVEQFDPYPLTKKLPAVARIVARTLRDEGLTD
jgi:hypothetical protein